MDKPFPEPPNLDQSTASALVAWLDAMADWLRADHAAARSHGRAVPSPGLETLDLYENAALLLREAYELR